MTLFHRARALATILVLAIAACGPAAEPRTAIGVSECGGPRLVTCERDIAAAVQRGAVGVPLVAAYLKAREANDAADPWAQLWAGLGQRRGEVAAAVVDTRPGSKGGTAPGAKWITAASLPEPGAVKALDLMLAMGAAAGYDHVVWLGAGEGGQRAYELYPNDPLAPVTFGLRSAARDDRAADHLEKNLEMAATLRRAFDAAGAFDYLAASKEGAALNAHTKGRDPHEEPVMRARYAHSLLAGSGVALSPPGRLFGSEPGAEGAPKIPEVGPPSDADTPYGDLLRVRLSDDLAAEWKRRGPRVLAGVPDDRREAVAAFFAPASCGVVLVPPAFDRPSDISFSSLMPGSLAGARAPALATTTAAGLPLAAWYARYEALVAQVEKAQLWWLEIGPLLRQRGELSGISPAGTASYRRVTEKGLAHIAALRKLSEAEPERYAATAELGLAYAGGLLGDEALRNALIDLTQVTTKGKLGRAEEPEAIADSLIVGALAGMSYPPAIQSAHYLALQSAFAAKVKGDLSKKTGWGAAGLFALDAIFRLVADLGPNLAFSSEQIVRTLSAPDIALPNVAAVVSAAARYAALAKDRPLAANVTPAQSTPERAAAREALRKAIVGMGAPGEAPAALADDITTLADGLIATMTIAAHRKAPPPGTCSDKQTAADIEIAHALAKLSDVRRKILQSPRYKAGDGLWARRARLLVTLLSDAMDFARPAKKGGKQELVIPAADVESALAGALREWDEPGAPDALVGLYGLTRFFLTSDPAKRFEGGGPYLIRALGGIGKLLRGDGPAGSATMLDALADVTAKEATADDIASALVTYAKIFYEKGQADQADLFLLGTLLITSVRRTAPPKEAIALAAKQRSRIEWALSLFAEVSAAETTGKPDVVAFAAGARKAAEEQCAVTRVDDMLSVLGAVAQWNEGKRKEARAALHAVLARAEAEGLVVPKTTYQYTEKHDKKVFTLTFALSSGVGFVDGANSFQVGLGVSSLAERSSKLVTTAASPEETATETARYYVRAAALAAAYDFLDGDPAQGAVDARRAASAIVSGVRLGARTVTGDQAKWAEDARALLAVDAQLAADAGLPFLAGDLLTIVKESLPPDADDAKVAEVLASPPIGLVAVKDAEPVIERARKTVRILAAPLACTGAKVETASFEQPTCGAYPLALALRVADVLKKLPHLRKSPGDDKEKCAALASLDAFLVPADQGTYDPDAFTKATSDLRASGRLDEASILLGRHRRDGHCNPALTKLARELGRSPALLSPARADMLSVAVNCWVPGPTADLEQDLQALDVETKKLADPSRNLKLLLFVAEYSLKNGVPGLLLSLVRAPGFLDRFLAMHGNAVAGAMILHHAAHLLAGEAFDPAQTEGPFGLVCASFPSDDRRVECDDLRGMRDAAKPAEARKALAKDALSRLLAPPAKPPAKRP